MGRLHQLLKTTNFIQLTGDSHPSPAISDVQSVLISILTQLTIIQLKIDSSSYLSNCLGRTEKLLKIMTGVFAVTGDEDLFLFQPGFYVFPNTNLQGSRPFIQTR